MIYKNILCIALLHVMTTHGMTLAPDVIADSSSDYLIDFTVACNAPSITLQVGQVLCARNYLYTVTTYDQIIGSYETPPSVPGYTPNQGTWVWVADSVDSETGVWYWIHKTESAYVQFFMDVGQPI